MSGAEVPFTTPTPSATVGNATITGTTGTALTSQTATITLTNETVIAAGLTNVNAASWFTNLPAGMTATADAATGGATSITITFGGTPTATSSATFDITIPASALTGAASLAVTTNAAAVFAIGSPATTYPISFSTNNVAQNGLTPAGVISPASPQASGTGITVTVTLSGTATAAGTHTVGLTSATLGAGITAPGTVTRTVTASENVTTGNTFAFTFTMPANAVNDLVVTHTFSAAPSAPVITTTSLPNGTTGTPYTQTLTATGSAPITWSIINGSLPAGLTLNMTTGVISGTPTASGSFTFTVQASNIVSSATQTLTLTVASQSYYSVNIGATTGGTVSANKTSAYPGETVTLTITPNAGNVLISLRVSETASPATTISISGVGATRSFTMPAANVTVDATFQPISYQSAWELALAIIEAYDFSILQRDANTLTELRYRLADIINELIKNTGFVISPNDIVIFTFNFRPAVAGDVNNPQGVNGYFDFRVSPPNARTSAYNDGVINATPYNDVANEQLTMNNEQLRAWTQNGFLYITGLTEGIPWYIYNLYGQMIYTGIADGNKAEIPLQERGVYIIQSGGKVIKTIY